LSGFVGIVNSNGAPIDRRLLDRLTSGMSYCGPDHQGVWCDEWVGLGHALLGTEPTPSDDQHQPYALDGRAWIVADARIDGRIELSRELRSRGRAVTALTPDARLILHAYEAWGERCVEHLVGDFAFAIWNRAERRLFCARDHFKVVPFYYARTENGLLFGNVLWTLRAHPEISGTLDERTIGDYLLFGINMDHAATTFAEIRSLPPSHTLSDEHGTIQVRRYWQAPEEVEGPYPERPEEHVARFRTLFDQAVTDRLRANRAGPHLSGGMDSTSVAATAKHVLASTPSNGTCSASGRSSSTPPSRSCCAMTRPQLRWRAWRSRTSRSPARPSAGEVRSC
jgi:asparagine synthase (glutamine-hydrolysing)